MLKRAKLERKIIRKGERIIVGVEKKNSDYFTLYSLLISHFSIPFPFSPFI
jgi:hypothetical protein